MITPALRVLLLMAFSKAGRENVLWKANWRALAFAPYCTLIPTLVAFAAIAISSWMGWGRSAWFAFSTAGVQVSGGRWLFCGENKTGPCSLATSS
jgi:hypothetical protein